MLAAQRLGLADGDPAELGRAVLACWDAFLDVVGAPGTDLSRPSRLPGLSGSDVCIHLGAWPDSHPLTALLDSARTGGTGSARPPDESSARLVAAHRGDGVDEVLAALSRARAALAEWFATGEPDTLGRATSASAVGPLPVLSLVHAATYELAVHALDLAPCGAPAPAPLLLDRGLAALIDVTGALAARAGVDITVTAQSPQYGWRFSSAEGGWTTARTPAGPYEGCGVRGRVEDLLDTSAGRAGAGGLLLRRRLVVQDPSAFLRLAPLLGDVPGLPGGAALASGVAGLQRLVRPWGRR